MINVNGLMGFYLVASIALLALAIVAFPTLWENAKKRSKKKH